MSRVLRILFACVLSLATSSSAIPAVGQAPADLILAGGKVFTADPERPYAEAVAVRGGRVVAVGTDARIRALAGPRTRRVELGGRLVVPGFNDAHYHFAPDPRGHALRFTSQPPGQPPEPSWQETVEAVRSTAAEVPRDTWIFGEVGSRVVLDPEATRFALDRVAPDHPVLLRAYYGHGYVINTKAMSLLRIAEGAPDPAGGTYDRVDGSRKINGRLWEYTAWNHVRALTREVNDEEAIAGLRAMSDEAVGYGVTSLQVMSTLPVGRFARLLEKADLPVRVRAIPFSLTSEKERDLSEIKSLAGLRLRHPKVKAGGIKWVLDGTPFEHGAAMRRPYDDRPGWSGRLNFPAAEIAAIVRESLRFDRQLLLHCSGDGCAAAVLDALERATPRGGWPRRRVRIEHGDGVREDLIPRARRLGVVVVQNPTHFAPPELFHRRWGAEMQPLRSLLEAGVPVALGSDGPMNPYLNVMLAAAHPNNPREAITREQAVAAYTRGSAYAEFAEREKGTVAEGRLADLAVLSQDIFVAPPGELPATRSLLTVIGGRVVYDAGVLR